MSSNEGKNELKETVSKPPDFLDIFIVFFRIGFFTFGGGLAMIAVIKHELLSKGWLNEEEFVDSLAIATAFPGAIAVNISLVVGHKIRGVTGAFVAMLGVVIPSFTIILLVAFFILEYFKNSKVTLFFKGAGASVAGLITYAAVDMGKTIIKSWKYLLLSSLGIVLGLILQVNPLWIILISAIIGYLISNEDENDDTDG